MKPIKYKMHLLLILILLVMHSSNSRSQILFPESLPVIFDTTRSFKGSITPDFNMRTQKKLLVEINNTSEVAVKIKNNSLIISNKFELERYGSETVLSGGYFYVKFKDFTERRYMVEYYSQYQWAEARGLDTKYAFGANLRIKAYKNLKGGLFTGIGSFYEFERWIFDGVKEENLPEDTTPVSTKSLKLNYYISFKSPLWNVLYLDLSLYYHSKIKTLFTDPRVASSTEFSYQINDNVSIGIAYQNIYDFKTIVPIDNWYHRVYYQLSATF
ncbi:hypothetical protein ACFL6I_07090 [candidate division KSB1 bacterium]